MAQDYFRSSRKVPVSSWYRVLRTLVRVWATIFASRVRVLAAQELPEAAPAIFVVTQPGGWRDILLLVASTDRPIHCLVDRKLLRSAAGKFLAWGLGMIPFQREGEEWRRAAERACNVLGNLGSIAVFTELHGVENSHPARFASTAATIALEAESRNAFQLDAVIVPVYLFQATSRLGASEHLVSFGRRIPPQAYLLAGKALEDRRQALSAALDEACRNNVFRLRPDDVRYFLHDLEEVLLADLREDFASRSNWKQKVDDFELSGFVREWIEALNVQQPARLVALRELHRTYRQALRQASLERLEIEAAGPWLQSGVRRVLGWAETLAGSPVALLGLVNHLAAGLVLKWTGLWKKRNEFNRAALWISRGAVALGFYAAQTFIVNYLMGRAAAGYYALSLPLSGLYLWRYAWLVTHRTRLLALHALVGRRAERVRTWRRAFVQALNSARDSYVEALEVVH